MGKNNIATEAGLLAECNENPNWAARYIKDLMSQIRQASDYLAETQQAMKCEGPWGDVPKHATRIMAELAEAKQEIKNLGKKSREIVDNHREALSAREGEPTLEVIRRVLAEIAALKKGINFAEQKLSVVGNWLAQHSDEPKIKGHLEELKQLLLDTVFPPGLQILKIEPTPTGGKDAEIERAFADAENAPKFRTRCKTCGQIEVRSVDPIMIPLWFCFKCDAITTWEPVDFCPNPSGSAAVTPEDRLRALKTETSEAGARLTFKEMGKEIYKIRRRLDKIDENQSHLPERVRAYLNKMFSI